MNTDIHWNRDGFYGVQSQGRNANHNGTENVAKLKQKNNEGFNGSARISKLRITSVASRRRGGNKGSK